MPVARVSSVGSGAWEFHDPLENRELAPWHRGALLAVDEAEVAPAERMAKVEARGEKLPRKQMQRRLEAGRLQRPLRLKGKRVQPEEEKLPDPWASHQGDPWTTGWRWREGQESWNEDWSHRWSNSDWWGGGDRGKDFSDPPAWSGWAHYRLWRKAVVRWSSSTDVLLHRRADRILKTMDWELQARFEHIPDSDLCGEGYIDKILAVLDVLAGEKQTTEKRRAVRCALFEGNRRSEESLSQFALRREQEFALAERFVSIPTDLKAILMEENAGLGKQGVMNLRTLTSGSGDFNTVVQALKVLDTEEESITGRGKSSHFVGHAAASG